MNIILMNEVLNMAHINKELAANLRSDFVTRLRSVGLGREQIAKIDFYLDVSIDNVNELARLTD
jgi:hypothetical protein